MLFSFYLACAGGETGKDGADAQASNASFMLLWRRGSKQFFMELSQVGRRLMLEHSGLMWMLLVPNLS